MSDTIVDRADRLVGLLGRSPTAEALREAFVEFGQNELALTEDFNSVPSLAEQAEHDERSGKPFDHLTVALEDRVGDVVAVNAQLLAKAIQLADERKKLAAKRLDTLEAGWGVIANANGGDWKKASAEWQAAAAKFRDDYHATIKEGVEDEGEAGQ